MSSVSVYIPSCGRADKVVTLKYVSKVPNVFLVVPKSQVDEYTDRNKGVNVLGCPVDGIANLRQWIFDYFDEKFCVMIDDDMRFFRRMIPGRTSEFLKNYDVTEMIDWMETSLENGWKHCTVASRMFIHTEANNRSFKFNTRACNIHGYDSEFIRSNIPQKFTDVQFMEDYHMTLSLFEAGYGNVSLLDWCWNQDLSGGLGGCSGYRTPELQKKAAIRLRELHPEFVKVVRKFSEYAEKNSMGDRIDVKISWAKAAKKGQK